MTKEESKIMQGVAILLMLFLHLFSNINYANECQNYLYIGGLPLVNILSRATNPVAFFLILSGYGLYCVESRNKEYSVWKKIKKLYLHYWITLLVFIPIGALVVGTQSYPGSITKTISNITGWQTTWNPTVWFLFPYMLLALSSKVLFRLMDRFNIWLFMGGVLFISTVAAYCISRYGSVYLYQHQWVNMPVTYFDLLFAFCSGAWMAKYRVVNKCKRGGYNWLILILLVTFRCCFETGAFHTFYAIAFILLFVNARRYKWMDGLLMEMGRRSTSMWFVHIYFSICFFHSFIYGFKYPILIFVALLICSYTSAIVIDYINSKMNKWFFI